MLMWLSEQLLAIDPGFAVFQYLTLRGILAACTALAISMVVGPYVIERLNQLQIGQTIREEGPQSHLQKAGTPKPVHQSQGKNWLWWNSTWLGACLVIRSCIKLCTSLQLFHCLGGR